MKVVGKGRLKFTTAEDECPHAWSNDPDWQESVVIYVWDGEQQCYAFLRIGHEPNQGAGSSTTRWKTANRSR